MTKPNHFGPSELARLSRMFDGVVEVRQDDGPWIEDEETMSLVEREEEAERKRLHKQSGRARKKPQKQFLPFEEPGPRQDIWDI